MEHDLNSKDISVKMFWYTLEYTLEDKNSYTSLMDTFIILFCHVYTLLMYYWHWILLLNNISKNKNRYPMDTCGYCL